ncbi:hypothetical protein SISNIDRAFT_496485 [Sistotremastrum niveocremeum HHB9708]|uniref:Uncharacterized protein n=1 Tax=Sistotremastrum niveocremeum HHB9708 TaxID=1314777 RepID=A0A164SMP0_9AGAM|nr:hypothetical protein SISNIDRAFT_496485 [Sistotremastrum niveocremeum HHB9708]
MFQLTSENQEALEATVVKASAEHERVSYRSNGIYRRTYCLGDHDPSYPDLFIKYNDNGTQRSEAEMLQRIYALACKDGDAAPHVPEPIHCFKGERALVYLVMRHIERQDVSPDVLVAKAASVVQWLRSKRYTAEEPFGIQPHSLVHHRLFKDRRAPLPFTNVLAAEKYFNTALHRIRRPVEPIVEISLTSEDVVLTQSDMDESNFATIRGLPLSLADYTLLRTTPFAKAVAECMFDPVETEERLGTPTMKSLVEVRKQLRWTYDDSLGLDADGNVKYPPRQRSAPQPASIESA